ncbi:RES family NAD+ phosphorylase [Actinocorallia longicatena]|uniref:RES domain-containing protein n=1 Tax=Actinocorallia longicatena TaxID=111803 RepID=A0ABP6Q254_9ACTN
MTVPSYEPPAKYVPTPELVTLSRGTRLWRVHGTGHGAGSFNPGPADDNFGGNRFDGTRSAPYPFLYAGFNPATALAETLLRDLPFDEKGIRRILRGQVADRRATSLRVRRDLVLVSLLTEEALNALAQDHWLIDAPQSDYHRTRRWAAWIRKHAPGAHGMVWPSLRRRGDKAVVLFGDRCEPTDSLFTVGTSVDLTDVRGAQWINYQVARARARIRLPRS